MKQPLYLKPGHFLAVVLVIQLALAQADLSSIGFLSGIQNLISPFFGSFALANSTPHAPAVMAYMTATTLMLPLTVYGAYKVLVSFDLADKRLLFVFPSDTSFSLTRRVFESFLVVVLCVGATLYIFEGLADSIHLAPSAKIKIQLILAGGWKTWLGWVIAHLTVLAFVWAALVYFLMDWFSALKQEQ